MGTDWARTCAQHTVNDNKGYQPDLPFCLIYGKTRERNGNDRKRAHNSHSRGRRFNPYRAHIEDPPPRRESGGSYFFGVVRSLIARHAVSVHRSGTEPPLWQFSREEPLGRDGCSSVHGTVLPASIMTYHNHRIFRQPHRGDINVIILQPICLVRS